MEEHRQYSVTKKDPSKASKDIGTIAIGVRLNLVRIRVGCGTFSFAAFHSFTDYWALVLTVASILELAWK
jgi:hypothetical protein